MARMLRPRGPIVVDVGGVDRLAAVALLILHRAVEDARRAGRTLTVRHLRPETVHDLCSVRVLRGLWSDPPAGPLLATRETRTKIVYGRRSGGSRRRDRALRHG
jgi:hypothetical protein